MGSILCTNWDTDDPVSEHKCLSVQTRMFSVSKIEDVCDEKAIGKERPDSGT